MKRIALALIAASLSLSPAFADDAHHKQSPLSDGEIRKVDKVKFEAQKLGGAFTVTKIEAAK